MGRHVPVVCGGHVQRCEAQRVQLERVDRQVHVNETAMAERQVALAEFRHIARASGRRLGIQMDAFQIKRVPVDLGRHRALPRLAQRALQVVQ